MTGIQGNTFSLTLNGQSVEIRDVAPNTTLLDWLRGTGQVGTKCGCAEGDCGACTVALLDVANGKPAWRSINSCIALLPMFAGRELMTVEGLAKDGQLHPVQRCMVKHGGSQCGYCTPGVVMSMFEGYERGDCDTPAKIADQLCGNLCRCTGYRPIRDAAVEAIRSREGEAPAESTCHRSAGASPSLALDYRTGAETFHRPISLAELFALRREFPDAQLVAGATEIGVLINKRFLHYPRLISTEAVAELREITATPDDWSLGATATLTQIGEALAHEFPSFDRMLGLFASRQIRNRATLGGNLATASPIGDSTPVLLSLGASLVLVSEAGERRLPLAAFFTGYRQTALRPGELIKSVIVPRVDSRRAEFFKVSKRREMDISIVAAAFCVETDGAGVVTHARLAFGGVAATPARARRAEEAALGQTLAASLADVTAALHDEFAPIDDLRGSAEYRRGLIVNLWEKFVRGEASAAHDALPDFVSENEWPPGETSKALAHESGIAHVTGRAQYVDDVAQRRPMLDLWPVCAPHAHAKIRRRDATEARTMPGVHAVLFAEDIPGHNNVGVSRKDETLLADTDVLYHGHMVAVVVGDSLTACRAAAAKVLVEYEMLPPIVTIREAIAAESFHTEPNFMRRGDIAAALAGSPQTFTGEFELGGQEHFYLETHAAWAEVDAEGNVVIASSTQHPSEIQTIVAEVLHLPRNRVVVQAPRMGGGFGGKETQGNTWAALTALASLKTGRPVRVQLDRDLDMQLSGKRHPFYAKFEVGHDADGRFTALKCDLISNGGWSLDLSMPVTDRAMFHIDNAYYIPAVEVSGRVARTHLTSQTAFRGFGGPQGMLVIEEIIDRIARRLRLPAHVVRARNLYRGSGETNTTHYGEEIGDNRIQTIWQQLLAGSDFERRRAEVAAWNAAHPGVKRGLAITPVKFGISFTYTAYNQAGALVLIYRDGTVQVNHGGTEMGQGLHTKILGIAMRELGLPAGNIRMMMTATDKVPNTSATAASSGADLNGAAVQNACAELRGRLEPVAAELLQKRFGRAIDAAHLIFDAGTISERGRREEAVDFSEVVEWAYMQRLSLAATGYYSTPDIHWDRVAGRGRPFHYYACGAAVSEVEVDGYTGMSTVRRVDILHDVGDSLNPGVDRGQIEGGFVQGMGWLTREDLRWDAKGRLLSHSASTYQIPAFSDAPADFRVSLFKDAKQPAVVHGSKAVGEPPLMLAISVREAIREAVAAFGASGEIALASPATGEAIFTAVQLQRSTAR